MKDRPSGPRTRRPKPAHDRSLNRVPTSMSRPKAVRSCTRTARAARTAHVSHRTARSRGEDTARQELAELLRDELRQFSHSLAASVRSWPGYRWYQSSTSTELGGRRTDQSAEHDRLLKARVGREGRDHRCAQRVAGQIHAGGDRCRGTSGRAGAMSGERARRFESSRCS